jgi:hypothetical protein
VTFIKRHKIALAAMAVLALLVFVVPALGYIH